MKKVQASEDEDSDDNIYDAPSSYKRRKIAADDETEDLVTEATQALANLRTSASSSGGSKIDIQVNTTQIATFDGAENARHDSFALTSGPQDIPLPESDEEGEPSQTEFQMSLVERMDSSRRWIGASNRIAFGPPPPPDRPTNLGLDRTPNSQSPESRLEDHPRYIETGFIETNCGLCGQRVGPRLSPSKGTLEGEKKVYLPCGHWYGHECLYSWLSGYKGRMGRVTCPKATCILLRYECEHTVEPSLDPPRTVYRGESDRPIPWDCPFCMSGDGKKLRDIVKNAKGKVDKVCANQDIRSKSVLKFHERCRKSAEENLDKQQRVWAARNWKQILAAPLCPGYVQAEAPIEFYPIHGAAARLTSWEAPDTLH